MTIIVYLHHNVQSYRVFHIKKMLQLRL